MLHHGIDLHKRSLVLASLDASGTVVKRASIRAYRGDVQRYFRSLSRPHSAVVECTGSWYWLADTLRALKVPLTLAHARQLKAIAAAKVKTDPVDAHTLAQLPRADLIPEAHMVSAELRPYRDLLRTKLRLVQKRVGAKNSISRVLEKYNVPSPDELPPLPFLQAGLFQDQVELLGQPIRQVAGSWVIISSRIPTSNASSGSRESGGSGPSPSSSRSMTSNASPPPGTSTPTAGLSPGPTIPAAGLGTAAPRKGSAT